jgi:hypothetical protein
MQMTKTQEMAAAKAEMDVKTARKYCQLGKLPSDVKVEHTWRTRFDPFAEVWAELERYLTGNPGLEAKTLFDYLQRTYPGSFADGQLRTLQRRVKQWRALQGPGKTVMFPQEHQPGVLCQSDFTHMSDLGITIAGEPFAHMLYHFVLTYSNWETGTICFSESFESLSQGLQDALWKLGGVVKEHQSDRLSAAVANPASRGRFREQYAALLRYYGLQGRMIHVRQPHENGDVEQRHYRFKRALSQALMLRGSRDFASRADYAVYLERLFEQLNANRQARFAEELALLRPLPARRLESCTRLQLKVGPSSTIRVKHNVYSVHSRLIGERIEVRVYAEHLEVWYAQRCVERLVRLRGEGKHHIQYRHMIECLVRKPGAFERYRYRSDLFPTHRFRMAYDQFTARWPQRASQEYVKLLELAAKENEAAVDTVLQQLLEQGTAIEVAEVACLVKQALEPQASPDVRIAPVDLSVYDRLLVSGEEVRCDGSTA